MDVTFKMYHCDWITIGVRLEYDWSTIGGVRKRKRKGKKREEKGRKGSGVNGGGRAGGGANGGGSGTRGLKDSDGRSSDRLGCRCSVCAARAWSGVKCVRRPVLVLSVGGFDIYYCYVFLLPL